MGRQKKPVRMTIFETSLKNGDDEPLIRSIEDTMAAVPAHPKNKTGTINRKE
jgi:hypothetical protein